METINQATPDDLITISEAARIASKTPDSIRRWVRGGRIEKWGSHPIRVSRARLLLHCARLPSAGAEDENKRVSHGENKRASSEKQALASVYKDQLEKSEKRETALRLELNQVKEELRQERARAWALNKELHSGLGLGRGILGLLKDKFPSRKPN